MRYKTSQAEAERRMDALEPHDPYVRLLRLMFRLAEHLQVPLFRVRPCTRGVLSGDCPGQHSTPKRFGQGSIRNKSNSPLVGS
jgi:hypothetical protein